MMAQRVFLQMMMAVLYLSVPQSKRKKNELIKSPTNRRDIKCLLLSKKKATYNQTATARVQKGKTLKTIELRDCQGTMQ